jgi:cell division protein FtsN
MGLRNKRAVSAEVLKIAAALLIALAVFAIFISFAAGPKEAGSLAEETGESILSGVQNASLEIIAYNET